MTKDLEETLRELGPGYRAVVDRLLDGSWPGAMAPVRRVRALPYAPLVAAAAAAVMLGLCAVALRPSPSGRCGRVACYTVRVADAPNEYRLAEIRDDRAVKEMIRTQNPDGSWKNDFLTRRNAAALALSTEPEARIARKKALRNLRSRGLL